MHMPYQLTALRPSQATILPQQRVLVALASYGNANDHHLEQLIREYQSMSFDLDIVILSNIDKSAQGIECRVGFPSKDPWSLPFAHKSLFVERADQYDLFIYSEDDILITEAQLRAYMEVTGALADNEIAGFIRMEKNSDGAISYPDMHDEFHWDAGTLRSRAHYVLASFTNEHAACYILTQSQLRKAIDSGGFVVEPHDWKHDLLCSAATDPYIQCGFTKLIPISHFDDFTVHHLSNKYAGKVGVDEAEMRSQVSAMLRLSHDVYPPVSLLDSETRLWRRMFSKDYQERVSEEVISAIPPDAHTVLSVGCGSGAIECALVERGLRVVAVPLDPVVCGSAAAKGVEMVFGDFRTAATALGDRTFDCVLFLNMLHLVPDPIEILSLYRKTMTQKSVMIIQSPNMRSVPEVWRRLRHAHRYRGLGDFDQSGAHIVSVGTVSDWCHRSGLTVNRNIGMIHRRAKLIEGRADFAELLMSPNFVSIAKAYASAGMSPSTR
ncbi:MAG: methyltransferase domain-containing protein [Alcaligenaceae bacterium]|nr:MAG: methyltransferase domain-containing protein [Alcaligenaceae bacterium]